MDWVCERSKSCITNKNKIAIAPIYTIIYNNAGNIKPYNARVILTSINVVTNHNTEYTAEVATITKMPLINENIVNVNIKLLIHLSFFFLNIYHTFSMTWSLLIPALNFFIKVFMHII